MIWEVPGDFSEPQRWNLQSYLYRIQKIRLYLYDDHFKLCGAVQLMLVNRKKKTSLMRLVGWVNPLLPGKYSSSWDKSSVSPSHLYFFCFYFFFSIFWGFNCSLFTVKKLLCLLCLSHCKKSKKKEKKRKKGKFLTLTKKQKEKLGFLNVQKAIVLVKLLTVSWVFLNCWTKAAYRWHILYQRWRN